MYYFLIVSFLWISFSNKSYAQASKSNVLKVNNTQVGVTKSPAISKTIPKAESSTNYPVSYTVGRDGVQRVVREEKAITDFSNEVITKVQSLLKELFGSSYEELGESNLAYYAAIYERSEIISINDIPAEFKNSIPNIADLAIKDKYNPTEIYSNTTVNNFDLNAFNLFKYRVDYHKGSDLYFKIYSTDKVLKINRLK